MTDIDNSAELILQRTREKYGSSWQVRGQNLLGLYRRLRRMDSAPEFPSPTFEPIVPVSRLKKSTHLGIIVETRRIDAILFVIENFIEQTGLPAHLFLGDNNVDYMNSPLLTRYVEAGLLAISKLDTDRLTASNYNALLLSEELWDMHSSFDKMVVFQSDSCICPASPFELNDFLEFDYIGADWSRSRPIGLIVDGGSGGFSLRDIAKARQCLRLFDPVLWAGGEDGYFGFHMELLGGKVARSEDRQKFCAQENFVTRSFACHSVRSMSAKSRKEFFEYCPEAMKLNNSGI